MQSVVLAIRPPLAVQGSRNLPGANLRTVRPAGNEGEGVQVVAASRAVDVRALMVTVKKLRRVEKLPAAYDAIIAQTDDIPTFRRLLAKRDAYSRQVAKLRSRLRAASY